MIQEISFSLPKETDSTSAPSIDAAEKTPDSTFTLRVVAHQKIPGTIEFLILGNESETTTYIALKDEIKFADRLEKDELMGLVSLMLEWVLKSRQFNAYNKRTFSRHEEDTKLAECLNGLHRLLSEAETKKAISSKTLAQLALNYRYDDLKHHKSANRHDAIWHSITTNPALSDLLASMAETDKDFDNRIFARLTRFIKGEKAEDSELSAPLLTTSLGSTPGATARAPSLTTQLEELEEAKLSIQQEIEQLKRVHTSIEQQIAARRRALETEASIMEKRTTGAYCTEEDLTGCDGSTGGDSYLVRGAPFSSPAAGVTITDLALPSIPGVPRTTPGSLVSGSVPHLGHVLGGAPAHPSLF